MSSVLIQTHLPALERHVSTVPGLDVVLPASPEALLTSRRANILLFRLGTGEQVDSFGILEHLLPDCREPVES